MSEARGDSLNKASEGDDPDRFVTLGRVSGVHGIKGWIKVQSDTRPPENMALYTPLYLQSVAGWVPRELQDARVQGKNLVLKLAACDDRDSAEELRGAAIAVKRAQLPDDTGEGEYYWADLQGLAVVTTQGVELGTLDHLLETGSNDVMVVRGERERLVPYLWRQVVLEVDLDARRMVVDWDPEF